MENKTIITREQAIERIIKYLSLTSYTKVLEAQMLCQTHDNDSLCNFLGLINYVNNNSRIVMNDVIKNAIWNDLNEFRSAEGFFLPRTTNYSQYSDLVIL